MHRNANPQGDHGPAPSELPRSPWCSPWSWIRPCLDFSGWLEFPGVSFLSHEQPNPAIVAFVSLFLVFASWVFSCSLFCKCNHVSLSRADTFPGVLSWTTLAHFKRSHLCLQVWGLLTFPPPHLPTSPPSHKVPSVTTIKGSALCCNVQERKQKKEGNLTNTFACTRLLTVICLNVAYNHNSH